MRVWCTALLALTLGAAPAGAIFRAADLVVVPVAASLPGFNQSGWHTDLEILNVDSVAIDVMIIFLPTGNFSNTLWYDNIANHLGGRSADGFGYVKEELKDIAPGRAVILRDVVKETWGDGRKGALLIFAYEAGTLMTTTPPGGKPKLIRVTSRTYDLDFVTPEDPDPDDGQSPKPVPVTYGQQIPGLPWYYYLDMFQTAKGFNSVTFTGIEESADYRTAIGFVNISDRLTALEVRCILKAADGTELKDIGIIVQSLAHEQFDMAVRSLFGLTPEDYPEVKGATVTISVKNAQSSAADPTPALIVYGSRIDNRTNDPVYLEQAFAVELPWDCVFNGNCRSAAGASIPSPWQRPRPLQPPIALRR
jgi:hypothetical protein